MGPLACRDTGAAARSGGSRSGGEAAGAVRAVPGPRGGHSCPPERPAADEAAEAAVGPGSAAQPGENGDLLPPVRLGMQLEPGRWVRGRREPGVCRESSFLQPGGGKWDVVGEAGGEAAGAATTNRCGRESAR